MPAAELASLWWAYRHKTLRFLDLRAALAAREMAARRSHRDADRTPNFDLPELAALTGATSRSLRGSLRRLGDAGFLRWRADGLDFAVGTAAKDARFDTWLDAIPNHRRRVPVPRRILRLLAASRSPVAVATALAVLLRCLYARDGGLAHRGRLKASWVAQTFGVDRRRVVAERRTLVEAGWIAPEPGDTQNAQNRWGRAYVIDLGWGPGAGPGETPPAPEAGVGTPPPLLLDRDPLARSKDQDPAAGGPVGARASGEGGGEPAAPDLKAVRPEDLAETSRTLELHRQAAAAGAVGEGEAGRLRILTAAVHARSKGTRNPCGLFAAIVGRGLWSYLTAADEEEASRRLRALNGRPSALRAATAAPPSPPAPTAKAGSSEDALVLRAVRSALGGRGDPYLTLRCRAGGWTRERYDRAAAELDVSSRPSAVSPSCPLPAGVSGLGSALSGLFRSTDSGVAFDPIVGTRP